MFTLFQRHPGTVVLGMILIGLVISGCGQSPNGPEKSGRFWVFAADYGNNQVYRIDCQNDQLTDSISSAGNPDNSPALVRASMDGNYLFVGYTRGGAAIYDAQTLGLIKQIDINIEPLFITENNIMLGFEASGSQTIIHTYSLPSFGETETDHLPFALLYPKYNPADDLIYGVGEDDLSRFDSTYIVIYNYVENTIEQTMELSGADGTVYMIQSLGFELDAANKLLYFNGTYQGVSISNYYLICYDLEAMQVVYARELTDSYWITGLQLMPAEHQLVTVDRDGDYFPQAGRISIYDSQTGGVLGQMNLVIEQNSEVVPIVAPLPLAVTLDGKKSYVGSGELGSFGDGSQEGTITVINMETREIIKHIWPDRKHYIIDLTIAPKRSL